MARRRSRKPKTGSSAVPRPPSRSTNGLTRWIIIAAVVVAGVLVVTRKGISADAEERLAGSVQDGVIAQVLVDGATGRKVVQGSIVLAASVDRVWSVVTDYAHYSEIFPQMKNAKVERTPDGRRRLTAEVAFGPMTWPISMKINHEKKVASRLAEWDEPSGGASVNRGFWRVDALGDGTCRLVHRRDIARAPYPAFMLRAGILSRMDDIFGAVAKRLENGTK